MTKGYVRMNDKPLRLDDDDCKSLGEKLLGLRSKYERNAVEMKTFGQDDDEFESVSDDGATRVEGVTERKKEKSRRFEEKRKRMDSAEGRRFARKKRARIEAQRMIKELAKNKDILEQETVKLEEVRRSRPLRRRRAPPHHPMIQHRLARRSLGMPIRRHPIPMYCCCGPICPDCGQCLKRVPVRRYF